MLDMILTAFVLDTEPPRVQLMNGAALCPLQASLVLGGSACRLSQQTELSEEHVENIQRWHQLLEPARMGCLYCRLAIELPTQTRQLGAAHYGSAQGAAQDDGGVARPC